MLRRLSWNSRRARLTYRSLSESKRSRNKVQYRFSLTEEILPANRTVRVDGAGARGFRVRLATHRGGPRPRQPSGTRPLYRAPPRRWIPPRRSSMSSRSRVTRIGYRHRHIVHRPVAGRLVFRTARSTYVRVRDHYCHTFDAEIRCWRTIARRRMRARTTTHTRGNTVAG